MASKILRTFNLDSEIADKLKSEHNQSALVNELLQDYFLKHNTNINKIQAEITKIDNSELNQRKKELELQLKQVEEEKIKKEEEIKQKEQKLVDKKLERRNGLKRMFDEDLGRSITDYELDEYLDLYDKGFVVYTEYLDELKKKDGNLTN